MSTSRSAGAHAGMRPDHFDAAIKAVAPRKFDLYRKLLMGAEARAELAERRANSAEAKVAWLLDAARAIVHFEYDECDSSPIWNQLKAAIAKAEEAAP